jgi:hypothetical protein
MLVGRPQNATAQSSQPDFELAYILATASYCAYTIDELEHARGHERAVACLTAAAAADSKHLGVFDAASNMEVEVYFDPGSPQDAYLLIREEKGVILAFRGTLAPPLSPSSRYLAAAVTDAVTKYNLQAGTALRNFAIDWLDNIKASATPNGRHSGFDVAWQRLLSHLNNDCRTNPASVVAEGRCSRFLEFVEKTNHLFVTGHSKGGAIATLATLDLPKVVGSGTTVVTYTFEAPKSLTSEFVMFPAAVSVRDELREIWRFEHKDDLVPLVPLDKSEHAFPLFLPVEVVFDLKAYTHVGSVVFLERNKEPFASDKVIDDLPKLKEFFEDIANIDKTELQNILANWANPGQLWAVLGDRLQRHCRQLVDNHFAVFADLQEIVWAKDRGEQQPILTEADWDHSFFAVGIPDQSGTVMWGFRQWCDLFAVH